MTFAIRLLPTTAACVIASVISTAAQTGPTSAQPNRDAVRTSYIAVIDENCRGYRVALAFPKSEHDRIKAAVKAQGEAGPYPEIARQFAQNIKVVGLAGACQDAFKRARAAGATEAVLQPDKEFLSQQTVVLDNIARLRTVQDLCKRLVVDTKSMTAELEKHGLNMKESYVRKRLKLLAYDEYRKHRNNPSPFCLDMYGKWSASGMVRTRS